MGTTVWVDRRIGDKRIADRDDHNSIYRAAEFLDRLCDELCVDRISTFFDDTDIRYNFTEEFPESPLGWPIDAATWHEPSRGLQTIVALEIRLRSIGDVAIGDGGDTTKDVLTELEDCRRKLDMAKARGELFHLLVVM